MPLTWFVDYRAAPSLILQNLALAIAADSFGNVPANGYFDLFIIRVGHLDTAPCGLWDDDGSEGRDVTDGFPFARLAHGYPHLAFTLLHNRFADFYGDEPCFRMINRRVVLERFFDNFIAAYDDRHLYGHNCRLPDFAARVLAVFFPVTVVSRD